MIAAALLFLQVAATDRMALVVKQGQTAKTVPMVATVSGAYIRADLLASALGGSAATGQKGRYVISLGDSRIELTEGLPFVRVNQDVVPTGLPSLRSGSTFLIPFQVASVIIPRFTTGYNYDLATGVMQRFSSVARKAPEEAPAPASEQPGPTVLPTISGAAGRTSQPRRTQRRLIVIDAGHGGPDNGMTGPIGAGPRIVEKNVTLAVAAKVARELRNSGVDVLMTRTTDTLIALSDRGRIANRNKGDLFVSVHVNATGSRGPAGARERGYETYFLAEAKSEDALRVEKMENEAVKFETGANAPKGDPLSFIINDMAQNEHLRESNDLAETIQDGLRRFHPGKDRGVQQANFAVLRGSYMPAVLVEIGFGTNPAEAAYLLDSGNQDTIAQSIAKGVLDYLDHYDARVGAGSH
ncbi:MAG TPA: N-acetylmuramoyl-L-alanine amidase [Gemmatimonadaceae bacterium]|nr:N-acetylmuramoyl-L-alanine amidase [Gemmatimonadaceae bacterium]